MLGLVNDWVGMWMRQVLQWVQLQGRDPLAVVGDEGRRFAVGKSGDGISKAGVGAGERLGGDVNGTGLAGLGSTSSGGGQGQRTWQSWMVCGSGWWGVFLGN